MGEIMWLIHGDVCLVMFRHFDHGFDVCSNTIQKWSATTSYCLYICPVGLLTETWPVLLGFHLQPLLTGFPSSFHVTFDEPPARGADLDDIRPLLEQHDGHADGSQDPWHGAVHLVCPVCSLSARCYLTWPFASLGGKKRIALPRHFHSGCGPRVQHRKRLGRARGAAGQQCRGLARRLQ